MTPHLCHVFPSFGTGGPEVRTAQIVNTLGGAYRHTIIALNGVLSGRDRLQSPDNVGLVAGPARRGRLRHPYNLAQALRKVAPNAVLTYGWGGTDGILAARMAGIRRILHAEDGFLPEETRGEKWARRLTRRLLLRLAAAIVVPSRVLVRICARSWGLAAARVRYVPNGIDLERFVPPNAEQIAQARRRFNLPAESLVVGTVGRLGAEKNHRRLLRIFAHVATNPSIRLLLVGDGPLRASLEQQARELELASRVHFAGTVADPRDCYRAMDVFALSSDTEQMPLVVLEAMATGLPIVSTDVGDVRDMVADANQDLVVPRDDEASFAVRLAGLLETEKRPLLGVANREACRRRFGLETMIDMYHRLYDEVLESAPQ